ncbi:MAG: hypothetical protein HC906_06400 [Bacteroidales bacterium]|nr:hypothetical protein [Bacteroidales bacterium]
MIKKLVVAILICSGSIQANAQDKNFIWSMSIEDLKQGNFHGAITYLNEYLKMVPTEPGAYFNRGMAKFNLGDIQGACEDFSHADGVNVKSSEEMIEAICDKNFKYKF